ncbi:MAG: hypothetical protein V8S54_00005, partial [Lachnospiraceae bacterium]
LVFKERIHYLARTEHLHRRFPPAILIGIGLIAGNILVGCSSGQTGTNFNAVTAQSDDTPLSTPTETPHSTTTTPSGQKASPGIRMQKRQKWQCTQEPTNP